MLKISMLWIIYFGLIISFLVLLICGTNVNINTQRESLGLTNTVKGDWVKQSEGVYKFVPKEGGLK